MSSWTPSSDDRVFAAYNSRDTYYNAQLALTLRRVLHNSGHLPYYEKEVATQLPAVLAIQRRGIPFSQERKSQYRRRLRRELGEIDKGLEAHYQRTAHPTEAHAAATTLTLCWALCVWSKPDRRRSFAPFTKGQWEKLTRRATLNPNSKDQLREWLFVDLGLRPSTRTPTKAPSVDQDALQRILQRFRVKDEPHRPIIHDLMHRARLQKIDQDYLDPTVVEGWVYPSIKMLGTESGRFAYSDPPVHSWPDEVRQFIEAPPGYLLVSADYSAVESRIFSHLTQDTIDLNIFEMNRLHPSDPQWDIHIRTACDLFGWSLEEFMGMDEIKRKGARNSAKSFRYGVIQYGGRPETVKGKVFCPCSRCAHKAPPTLEVGPAERTIQARRWFARHPNVLTWRRRISEEVRRTGRTTTVMGQVRYFSQPWDSRTSPNALEREAWNSHIQPVATTILRRAMRALHPAVDLFLEHHDSLKAIALEADARRVASRMKEVMEAPVPEFGGAIFPVELEVGPNLGEMKKLHL